MPSFTQSTISKVTCHDCDCGCSCDTGTCGTDCKTGTVTQQRTHLPTNHGSFSSSWYNQFTNGGSASNPNFGAGTNVLIDNWAYVTSAPNSLLAFIWSPTQALWFSDPGLAASFGARQTLTEDASNYRIYDPDSGVVHLFDKASGLLNRTWEPRKTQLPITAGVRAIPRVGYWLQMTFDAEVADDLLLVGRRPGRCLETAFRVAGDDDRRTCDRRQALQNVTKTR